MRRLSGRVTAIEEKIHFKARCPLVVILADRGAEARYRDDVTRAYSDGRPMNIISFNLLEAAATVEEAEAKVAAYRNDPARGLYGISVMRHGEPETILASWEPDLPDWLNPAEEGLSSKRGVSSLLNEE